MKKFSTSLGLLLILFFSLVLAQTTYAQQTSAPPTLPTNIHGKVTVNGRPAPRGFRVSLKYGQSGAGGGSSVAEEMTDSAGNFEFRMVPYEILTVEVSEPGYRSAREVVDLRTVPTAYVLMDMKPLPSDNTGSKVPPEGPGGMISVKTQNVPAEAQKQFDLGQQAMISKPEDAAKAFKKATEIYPKFEEAQLWLGLAEVGAKNYTDAEKAFDATIKLNDKSAAAYTGLGMAQNFQGKFADAEKTLIKAAELDPQSAEAQFQLGKTYWGLQRWPDAATHLTRAIQLKPENAEAHILMGNVYLRQRNAASALKEFQEGLRLDPKGPLAEPTRQMVAKIESAMKASQK